MTLGEILAAAEFYVYRRLPSVQRDHVPATAKAAGRVSKAAKRAEVGLSQIRDDEFAKSSSG